MLIIFANSNHNWNLKAARQFHTFSHVLVLYRNAMSNQIDDEVVIEFSIYKSKEVFEWFFSRWNKYLFWINLECVHIFIISWRIFIFICSIVWNLWVGTVMLKIKIPILSCQCFGWNCAKPLYKTNWFPSPTVDNIYLDILQITNWP